MQSACLIQRVEKEGLGESENEFSNHDVFGFSFYAG